MLNRFIIQLVGEQNNNSLHLVYLTTEQNIINILTIYIKQKGAIWPHRMLQSVSCSVMTKYGHKHVVYKCTIQAY